MQTMKSTENPKCLYNLLFYSVLFSLSWQLLILICVSVFSSKGLFRDNKLIPSSNWFAGKESADVIEGSGFMYDHLYVE